MFEDIQGTLNGMFGAVPQGKCRITMNGGIAIKCKNGSWKSWNVKKGTLTNVTNFCIDLGAMFFVIPTSRVEVGDIIMVKDEDGELQPKCVTKVIEKKRIEVIDYNSSEIRTIVPERHIFMGSTYFYGKIISMFGNLIGKGGNMKNLIQMMMMGQLMGGQQMIPQSTAPGQRLPQTQVNPMASGFGQMMMMSMLMKNNGDGFDFGNMFDFELGSVDDDDDEEDPTEEETPKKSKKSKTDEEE